MQKKPIFTNHLIPITMYDLCIHDMSGAIINSEVFEID